jgi:hypothetical protein
MASVDPEGDTVMGDYPPEPNIPQLQTQSSLANFTMTFGKFKGEKICELPSWYLNWLPNISDPSPTFQAALTYALTATSFSEMEIDWYPPSITSAPDKFHQWRMLDQEGKSKSADTALWITGNDIKEYFCLSDEILRIQLVPKLPNDEPSQTNASKPPNYQSSPKRFTNVPRYALYHIWNLAQVYMAEGEVDFALWRFMNERLRGKGTRISVPLIPGQESIDAPLHNTRESIKEVVVGDSHGNRLLNARNFAQVVDSTVRRSYDEEAIGERSCHVFIGITWQLQQCIRDELEGNPDLTSVLTISGNASHSWAVPCREYVKATWGGLGLRFLDGFEICLGKMWKVTG